MAVVLCLAVILAAHGAESADDPNQPETHSGRRVLVEMAPARAAQAALAPIVEGTPRAVEIAIESPEEGAIFSDAPVAHLMGSLEALGRTGRVDAVVVIDTSASTARRAERRDRIRERIRGRNDRWRRVPATILQQEIRSVALLMGDLDPRETRLAIVTFAGAPETSVTSAGAPEKRAASPTESARTEIPLTGRLEALDAALQGVARRGASGRTDMAAGLDRAVAELTGRGASRPEAAKVVVFFTDGTPTLPYREPRDNERTVAAAARRAAAAGVRVFSFAIGPDALRRPTATLEMARLTGGVFTPVRKPGELAEAVASTVEFTSVGGELTIRNTTLHANAQDLHVGEGGVFGGLVPLKMGKNRIFVRAVAGDLEIEATRSVHYAPGSVRVWTPPARDVAPVPILAGHRELEIRAGQQRTIELTLGDHPRKELTLGIGATPPPAAAQGRELR